MARIPDHPIAPAAPVTEGWRRNLRGGTELLGPRPSTWWTGQAPVGALRSLPLPALDRCTRGDLLDYFDNGWTLTEVLFSGLAGEEAFYRPPHHGLRHPMIFYYCHPAVLYVNKLRVAGLLDAPVNADFEQLFETGVDEMSWDDLSKNEMEWPAVSEVTAYRARVYRIVRRIIETHPAFDHLPLTDRSPAWSVLLGFEHERIHIELSSVLIRELPPSLVRPPEAWPPFHPSALLPSPNAPEPGVTHPDNPLLAVPGGEAIVGKPRDWPSYGWDNEYGERRFNVPAFEASKGLVSNGEFHAFVTQGGYQTPRYWSEEGWGWRSFRNVKWPTFWVPDGPAGLHRYRLRLLYEQVAMPWSWPVEINVHEARAYCAWRTVTEGGRPYRLLTEPEHHRLRPRPAAGAAPTEDHAIAFGGAEMAAHGINLALAWSSPSPVQGLSADAAGFHDLIGNVWQWCEDHFAALPGFEVHPYYDDFSSPCFDGKHHLILGGSFVSTGDEASVFARFQFRPHFHQFAGLRLVRSETTVPETSCMDAPAPHVGSGPCCTSGRRDASAQGNVYERQQMIDEYLLLHFGTEEQVAPYRFVAPEVLGFPRRCAALLTGTARRLGVGTQAALDVGCAVGGAVFELARTYQTVLGIDLSAGFIAAAQTLQREGSLPYLRKDEGEIHASLEAVVDPAIDRSRARFRQADACSLPADLGAFDAVLLGNLLCRLPSPRGVLGRMGGSRGLVRPGGLLLITTPCTWMEAFTPPSAWLGGRMRDGAEVRTLDGLHESLDGEFELLEVRDEPLLIREHARKFQYIVAQASLWRRRL